jgi:hypothetical protein
MAVANGVSGAWGRPGRSVNPQPPDDRHFAGPSGCLGLAGTGWLCLVCWLPRRRFHG